MIELKNICKTFTQRNQVFSAIHGLSLCIKRGEIFGLIGKSGAGKSTLLRCINLLERPTSGDVVIDGVSLLGLSARELRLQRKNIGMIFQHFNLLSSATVFENIALPLKVLGWNKRAIEARVYELLQEIDLSSKKANYPSELSGGQKQRVAIGRALATNPKILLCDEATSALDEDTTQDILSLLKRMNQKFNVTIVLITHEKQVIHSTCDRAALIEHGELKELFEIAKNPQNPICPTLTAQAVG